MNRLATTKNPYQGNMKKVLAVCSAGLLRSPTIAWVLSNPPYNCNTRAVGINKNFALIPVDEVLLEWCDEIVCAQQEHADDLESLFGKIEKPIFVIGIPDNYRCREPKAISIIEEKLKVLNYPKTILT